MHKALLSTMEILRFKEFKKILHRDIISWELIINLISYIFHYKLVIYTAAKL